MEMGAEGGGGGQVYHHHHGHKLSYPHPGRKGLQEQAVECHGHPANEMGKMATLCDMIVQALKSYLQLVVGKKFEVIPFGITFVLTNFGGGGGEVLRW